MSRAFRLAFYAGLFASFWTSATLADPGTGWVVTNWASGDPASLTVVDAWTDSPSVAPATGVSLMAGYPSASLNDGDIIQGSASMTITGATNPFIQFRIGLFRETDSGPSTGDGTGYTGFTIETEGTLKETDGATNPFSTPGSVIISSGTPFNESLSTPPVFTLSLSLTLQRDGDRYDIDGLLTDGDQYEEHFTAEDYLPLHGFSFNRIGFLVGQLAQADLVSLSDVDVTLIRAVPEPATSLMSLMAMLLIGGGVRARRSGQAT